MKMTQWKTHPIYRNYEASDRGDIRHKSRKKIRKTRLDKDGYRRINLYHYGKLITVHVSVLIIEAFIGLRSGKVVSHKNDIKSDDALENLQTITNSEKVIIAFKNGRLKHCIPVEINGARYYSKREAERKTGISRYKI